VFFYRNSTRQNDKFGVVQNRTYVCSEYQIFKVGNGHFSINVTGKKYALQCESQPCYLIVALYLLLKQWFKKPRKSTCRPEILRAIDQIHDIWFLPEISRMWWNFSNSGLKHEGYHLLFCLFFHINRTSHLSIAKPCSWFHLLFVPIIWSMKDAF